MVSIPLKNIRQNGFIFPNFRGENKKYLKPPPSITGFWPHLPWILSIKPSSFSKKLSKLRTNLRGASCVVLLREGFAFYIREPSPPKKTRAVHPVGSMYGKSTLVDLENVGKYIPYMDFFWAWLKMKIKSKYANGTIYWTWFNDGTPNNLKIWNHPNWQPTILIRGCFRFQDGTTSWCSLVHVQYTNLPIINRSFFIDGTTGRSFHTK